MKKILIVVALVLFAFNTTSFAEETKSIMPTRLSCKVICQNYKGIKLQGAEDISYYYQFDNFYRVDILGLAYIMDNNKKVLYSLYGKQYTEEPLNGDVNGYIQYCGFGFLNPQNFETIDTGKKETIAGFECEIKEVKTKNNEKAYIWQAPTLGNLGLKYETDTNDTETIYTVTEINTNLTDVSMFQLPKDGKSNVISIDPDSFEKN